MKIGLVIYGSIDSLSGGYLYDRMLVDYLRSQGDDVQIISIPSKYYYSNFADNWSRELAEIMNGIDIDLMLQDELNHPSLFRLNRKLRKTYPIISIVHHLRSNELHNSVANWIYRKTERMYLNSVDGYIFNSDTTKESVEKLTHSNKPYVVSKPGGDRFNDKVTKKFIETRIASNDRLNIIFIGNLIPRKQLMVLIEALYLIDSNLWHLNVVGNMEIDTKYSGIVKERIKFLGMDRNVTFSGVLSDKDLLEQLKCSDVLAVPSSWEGFGIVYLEGMAFGLPAIASTEGAAKEIINHGENGYLIDTGDNETLASHLRLLIEDRHTLTRMSTNALDTYANYPTWQDSGASSRDFLMNILEGN